MDIMDSRQQTRMCNQLLRATNHHPDSQLDFLMDLFAINRSCSYDHHISTAVNLLFNARCFPV